LERSICAAPDPGLFFGWHSAARTIYSSTAERVMDVVCLSNKTATAISALDSLSKDKLGKVCKYFLQTLVKGSSGIAMEENLDESLCAVSTLLLEAAKVRSSAENMK
jgi:hypothetical protein